jgi:MarR family transcriptional regulator, negative regulator of the multidrug operon emrRAB
MNDGVRNVAESITDFMPHYNDKLASLFPPSPETTGKLTKSQVRVLMLLRKRPGQTATDLGEGLNMTKASLTGILDELESRGLAERAIDPEDRRKYRLDLTGSGRKAAETIAREFEKALEARIAPLSAKDREAFARHLGAVSRLLAKL